MKPTIGWLVPSLIEGSGGIREIFNKINALVDEGYECHVHIKQEENAYLLSETIDRYYGGCKAVIHSGHELAVPYDLTFATIWWSAETVARTSGLKAYLIQDFEAYFNPMGDNFLLAEQSYRLGLIPITLGRWLPSVLSGRFGSSACHFDFCADTSTYHPIPGFNKGERSVCFIHQPEKPRRCSNIGLPALELLKQKYPELTIYLYGSREKAQVDFDHINLGILKPAEINELYNRCSAGLCISSSNPSRIPFEMMAAGLPVVDIYRENNLYDFPDGGVLLARPTPQGLSNALGQILSSPSQRANMSDYGASFMKTRPMAEEISQFLGAVRHLFDGSRDASVPSSTRLYLQSPVS